MQLSEVSCFWQFMGLPVGQLVWTLRNTLQFKGSLNLDRAIGEFSLAVEEVKGSGVGSCGESSSSSLVSYKWKPPHKGWLKINVGAAFVQNASIGAFIVRNEDGKVLLATSKVMKGGCRSAFEAEVSVLDWASNFADRCNWTGVVFGIDAKFVVDEVLAESEPNGWNTFERVNAIRSRFGSLFGLQGKQIQLLMI
ncbi:hypothetical protein FNV43_RR18904 [Rhamnella rubrinervis]|uniref:RNase H type-1 domain-containing protein n=1 Tax=Rhamnella rubrinervis TaxID=2594499 RepID=A0A8K0GY55_9ROSA|nr:hypothetical protein FNV43_RR18904 [Rhamnella rubrinervis]